MSDRVQEQTICATGSDIWREVAALNTTVHKLERAVESLSTSFPANDLGQPDYDGHRRSHVEQIESAKILKGYKTTAATKIVGVAAAFLMGAFMSGMVDTLKRILLGIP
jgi:hypothetical protein